MSSRVRLATAALVSTVLLCGPGTHAQAPETDPTPTFATFIEGIRQEALAQGIRASTLDAALSDLAPDPVVVTRDRTQPEVVQSLDAYLAQRLSAATISTARRMAAQHRDVLRRVESAYGVPHELMVAVWGLESNFGRFTGTYPTVRALATLAYDNRRTLFRGELFAALTMLDQGLVEPDRMKGSWAGAMGQPQFMPSSFLAHAVDFDGDNVANIWTSTADVFGSMANYLKNKGWTAGERWGREVTVSKAVLAAIDKAVPMRTSGCRARQAMTEPRPLSTWSDLGVQLVGGGQLPTAEMSASLVRGRNRYFLTYRNYEAILDYNCSHSYAIAAGLLADAVR